jgi:hypothetical protein
MFKLNFKSAFFSLVFVSLIDQSFGTLVKHDLYEKERDEIHSLYSGPMNDIKSILHITQRKCKRFPSENEFKEFILNGSHPGIKCTEKIMIHESRVGKSALENVLTTGRNIPKLVKFLESKNYKVYSDTKKIHVILDLNPKDWKYKTYKHEEAVSIISCIMNHGDCLSASFDARARSCRNRKKIAEHLCHLGGKKIIDY